MTTASEAFTVIKNRITANQPATITLLAWQGEAADLPETPAPFAYTEFLTDPADLAAFGGGQGNNLYRNRARIDIFVFVPKPDVLTTATDLAEQFATLFRSYRDTDISCFAASVLPGGDGASIKPPGFNSDVGNYFFSVVEVDLFFDQIG